MYVCVCFWIFVKESVCIWQINYWISRNREVVAYFCYFVQFSCSWYVFLFIVNTSDFSHIGMHAESWMLLRASFRMCVSRTWVFPLLLWIFKQFRIDTDTHTRALTRDRDDSDFDQSLKRRRRGKKKLIYHFDDGFSAVLSIFTSGFACVCERVLIWVSRSRLWFKYSWASNGIFYVEVKIRDFVKCGKKKLLTFNSIFIKCMSSIEKHITHILTAWTKAPEERKKNSLEYEVTSCVCVFVCADIFHLVKFDFSSIWTNQKKMLV